MQVRKDKHHATIINHLGETYGLVGTGVRIICVVGYFVFELPQWKGVGGVWVGVFGGGAKLGGGFKVAPGIGTDVGICQSRVRKMSELLIVLANN